MSTSYELIKQEDQRRYIIQVGEHTARIEYIENPEKTFLTHTEVPRELEGQGIGSTIVKLVLAHLEEEGRPVVPLCPFVAGYIKKHPEWKRVVAKGINIG